jgi:hypothetical protein
MEIKDVIHYYLGCDIWEEYNNKIGKLVGITSAGEIQILHKTIWTFQIKETKLILRPLSSMTKEDVREWSEVTVTHTPYCVELDSKDDDGEFTEVYPDGSILSRSKDDGDIRPINGGLLFTLLIKHGFDLFGLIESGQAIDSSKTDNLNT